MREKQEYTIQYVSHWRISFVLWVSSALKDSYAGYLRSASDATVVAQRPHVRSRE